MNLLPFHTRNTTHPLKTEIVYLKLYAGDILGVSFARTGLQMPNKRSE